MTEDAAGGRAGESSGEGQWGARGGGRGKVDAGSFQGQGQSALAAELVGGLEGGLAGNGRTEHGEPWRRRAMAGLCIGSRDKGRGWARTSDTRSRSADGELVRTVCSSALVITSVRLELTHHYMQLPQLSPAQKKERKKEKKQNMHS